MKKRVLIIVITVLLTTGILATIAFSQGFRHRSERGMDYGPGMMNSNSAMSSLTQDQTEKIQSLKANFDKEALSLRSDIQSKRLELNQLWLANDLDEKVIIAKEKEISDLQTQLHEKMIRHRLDVSKILTKEQRTQFSPIDGCCGRGYHRGNGNKGCGYGKHSGMGRWNR